MSLPYEEVFSRRTRIGELILRRRRIPALGDFDIYEVKLDGDLLMSSLLTESERALADLALAAATGEDLDVPVGGLDVLIGGLGLGYTARAALAHERVGSVTVVELLPEVIEWHETGLVPLGEELTGDPRCRFVCDDFFRRLARDPEIYGAILIDIDHAPDSWLHPDHAGFYGAAGLAGAAARLRPGGVFGFWSSGPEDEEFRAALGDVFTGVETHAVEVLNPLVGENQVDTIYVAVRDE